MFASIARRYDLANDVLSFGVHRLWRRKLVRMAALRPDSRVLDLCTGTGDLAFALSRGLHTSGRVYGLDFVAGMIELASEKKRSTQISAPVYFFRGDAMTLPFADRSFDAVTISFGIRNVDNVVECLREIERVLVPGGKALILEFGQPTIPLFREAYNLYSAHVMPLLGKLLTGNRAAYEYLPRTSKAFPAGESFLELMRAANFSSASASSLFGGVAYIYTAASSNTDVGEKPRLSERRGHVSDQLLGKYAGLG